MVEKVARSISCLALMEEIMNIIYEKWDEILETVKTEHELSDVSFKTWLKPLTIHSIDDQVVTILVPSQQVGLNYISKKYALPLKVAISELTGSDYDIKFVLPEDIQNVEKEVPVSTNYNTSMEMANLNPKYTFDTFVVGSNNKFAHAASLAVAESPGEIYNPLFLYGGAGLGKTHLMHSIAHHIINNRPDLRVLYVTSEKFTNELINAIKDDKNEEFRTKYRSVDVLLIDDIQFIAGKERTQEEFFHTFNTLHEANKQIILSSDRPPKEIPTLEDRLRSRFEWGLIADIQAPDFETRMAIVKKKADMLDLQLSDNVVRIIAEKIKTNIRQLEGTVNKIKALTIYTNESPSISMAQRIIKEIIIENHPAEITVDRILQEVAAAFDVTADDIKSTNRRANVSLARKIAIYIFKDVKGMTFIQIGNVLNKNHSTMTIHYQDVVKNLKENKQLKDTVDDIIKNLKDN